MTVIHDAKHGGWSERESGRPAYVIYLRVRFRDLDVLGHVNNAAYVDYMDQVAIDHAAALDLSQQRLAQLGGLFIARRHEIDYLMPAQADDRLQVVTWIAQAHGARAIRYYEIQRRSRDEDQPWPLADRALAPDEPTPGFGSTVLRARTDWAYVDVATGRPRRMPEEVMGALAEH